MALFHLALGRHITEQHIHSLDKAAWVMHDEPPVAASASAAGKSHRRTIYGNIYDHFAIVYEYANGTKLFSSCRQMADCHDDVSDHFIGTHGTAHLMAQHDRRANKWNYSGPTPNMYQVEHNELFAACAPASGSTTALHVPQHDDGDHGPHGGLHRPENQLGQRAGEQRRPDAAEIRMGPDAGPPVAMPGMTKFV